MMSLRSCSKTLRSLPNVRNSISNLSGHFTPKQFSVSFSSQSKSKSNNPAFKSSSSRLFVSPKQSQKLKYSTTRPSFNQNSSKNETKDWIYSRPSLKGSCSCGSVGWEGQGPSVINYICHSKATQKSTNKPFSEMAAFLPTQLVFKNREGMEVKQEDKKDGQRLHCKKCGDYVAHDATQGLGFFGLPLKLSKEKIDESYAPNHHIFYQERVQDVNDSIPKWKTLPDGEIQTQTSANSSSETKNSTKSSETSYDTQSGRYRKDVLSISPRKASPKEYIHTENDPLPSQDTFLSSEKLSERLEKKYYPSPDKFISPNKKTRDVIIIGGGHNGLVSAAYLAKKGLDVLVLERRHVVGGAAVTEELFPGFKFSRASYLAGLFRPQIIKDLELEKYGFKYLPRDPSSFTPSLLNGPLQGKSLLLGADDNANWKSIAQFSKKDADAMEHYDKFLSKIRKIINPILDGPPPDPTAGKWRERLQTLKQINELVKVGWANKQVLVPFYELFTAPAAQILDRWFESDILKTTLATDAVIGALISPTQPGSAYVLLHHVMGESAGREGVWAYSQGGMGGISQSIRKAAEKLGAEIALNATVRRILFENKNGKPHATGVRMVDGTEIYAKKAILSNCNPYHTFLELLPGFGHDSKEQSPLPADFRKHIQFADYNCGAFKINLAVDKLPNFECFPSSPDGKPGPQHLGTVHFEVAMEEIENAYREASMGIPASRPVIELTIPSSLDSTISPPGKHVINLFVQFAPYHVDPKIGSWADPHFKNAFVDRVFSVIDSYAPGFSKSVIARDVLSPLDLERVFGLHKGNIFHGALGLHQLAYARPAPGWARHRTPLSGLYLCGSGAHPGGGVMGAPGRNCANVVLSDLGIN